jgi:catechol 2,3-dioxygenase-like lactoylglutathione lyase family enzyme
MVSTIPSAADVFGAEDGAVDRSVSILQEKGMTKLLRGAPYFPVADVEASAGFYERVFGFECEYLAGSPAQFAICSRDGHGIMLRRVSEPDRIRPAEAQGGTWDAFFWIDDAQALHDELERRGADVVYGPLLQEGYQMLEFAVRDRDGHVLGFGQAVTS